LKIFIINFLIKSYKEFKNSNKNMKFSLKFIIKKEKKLFKLNFINKIYINIKLYKNIIIMNED